MVKLMANDTLFLGIKNLTGTVRGNYYYLTEPHYYVDVGYFNFTLKPIDFDVTLIFGEHLQALNITLKDINI